MSQPNNDIPVISTEQQEELSACKIELAMLKYQIFIERVESPSLQTYPQEQEKIRL